MWVDLARKAAAVFGRGATGPDPHPGPPPPTAMTDEGVEAWMAEHLDVSDWIYCYASLSGVCFAGRIKAAAEFQIPMRLENFATRKDQRGVASRSLVKIFDVDAEAGCFRLSEISSFRLNDLKEMNWRQESEPGGWVSLNRWLADPFFQRVRILCDEALGLRMAEGPVSWLSSDIKSWVEQTVRQEGDIFAYFDELGATYVQAGSVRPCTRGYALKLRIEFFGLADGARSETIAIELDIRSRRMRQIELRRFPEHNLAGTEEHPQRLNRWIDTRGTFTSQEFDRLCEIAKAELASLLP